MALYTSHIWFGLLMSLLPALGGIYIFVFYKKERLALTMLMISGLLIRLFLIAADPYLHDWDERFHALVAKNMMDYPFKPMLRVEPLVAYDYEAWCCNHVWVHKQPIFLWQMAISMHLFGVTEFAVRIPSALMGTVAIYFIYEIARFWSNDKLTAYTAAILACFSYFQLELSTGRFSLDHNDVAFTFFVTAGIWAFVRYIESHRNVKWVIAIGVLVGSAMLTKWLTGLLVLGGWGIYVLATPNLRRTMRPYLHVTIALLVACVMFIPWQIYTFSEFPLESAAAIKHNWLHVVQVLGDHHGGIFYHLQNMNLLYGSFFLPFIVIGAVVFALRIPGRRAITIAFLVTIVVVYSFFSFAVSTKMPAYPFIVRSILICLIAVGLIHVFNSIYDLKGMAYAGGGG